MKRIIAVLLLICATASADINVEPYSTGSIKLTNTETNIAALSIDFSGLSIASAESLDPNKKVKFNASNGRLIVYGFDRTPIKTGAFLSIAFEGQPGTHKIHPKDLIAVTGNAQALSLASPGDFNLIIYFTQIQFTDTLNQVLGIGSSGIDANKDGLVNIVDVLLVGEATENNGT